MSFYDRKQSRRTMEETCVKWMKDQYSGFHLNDGRTLSVDEYMKLSPHEQSVFKPQPIYINALEPMSDTTGTPLEEKPDFEKLEEEFNSYRNSVYTTKSSPSVLVDFLWFKEKLIQHTADLQEENARQKEFIEEGLDRNDRFDKAEDCWFKRYQEDQKKIEALQEENSRLKEEIIALKAIVQDRVVSSFQKAEKGDRSEN